MAGLLKKILSAIIVLIFSFSFSAFIFSFSFSSVALSPAFYLASFEKYDVYGQLQAAAMSQAQLPAVAGLAKDSLVPRSWIKESLDSVVSELLAYLKSERESFEGTISLAPLKSNVQSLASQFGVPVQALDLSTIPDTLSVSQQFGLKGKPLEDARSYVSLFFLGIYASAAIAILMLGLLAFLYRHSMKSVLKALGSALAFAGISAFAVSFIAMASAKNVLEGALSGIPQGLSAASAALSGIATDFISAVFSQAMLFSGIAAVIGILLLVASFFVRPNTPAGNSANSVVKED
ncbi:MAG: hypothetical protein HY394_04240 [Candidatus Diapherotrites archaeon]|nr:hypothetical protein [Candidatus Diapherotrites archaeon]